jgi:23S rRNA-/tRNA-specific pseudouridylate synthase
MQAAIRDGHVRVNGKPQPKTSFAVRAGDVVMCVLPPPPPLEAAPEVRLHARHIKSCGHRSLFLHTLYQTFSGCTEGALESGSMACCCKSRTRKCRLAALRVSWERCRVQRLVNRQAIPLEVVYEDAHLLVVNKQAGLVVHPSPGHASGTLVNALLHHCRLPAMRVVPRFAGGLESAALACAPTVRADWLQLCA